MNILIEKLAEFLETTIEQATKLYPILKQQYMWYKILDSFSFIVEITCIISALLLLMSGVIYCVISAEQHREEDKKLMKKYIKILLIIFIVGIVISLARNTATLLLAPDLMLLKEFLIK